ncbi:MAG: helix-turn-helix domain-containing protein [Oscillospiraceae bacterium]|nr:helix-turn-helix domain-containing protein [Oscillospiraceae bacterium]
MTLPQKLEILIRRKGITKTDVAALAGITYRALANYVSGGRKPRYTILVKMAEILNTSAEFLLNDNQGLILTSEERFVFNAESAEQAVNEGAALLDEMRKVFGTDLTNTEPAGILTDADKRALFACMSEIYFDTKARKN